ncbi:MAG: hypothetical protein ABR498_04660 [Candidatus Dormibacteria bacterium]
MALEVESLIPPPLRRRTLRRASLLLTALITACGSTTVTARSSATGASPTTSPVNATTFTTRVTDGWQDLTSQPAAVERVQAPGTVLLLLEAPPPSPVVRGLNDVAADIVVVQLQHFLSTAEFAGYLRSVSAHGGVNLSAVSTVAIGGTTGAVITYEHSGQGTPLKSRDAVVDDNGVTYEITLNASRNTFDAQASAMTTMLQSWHWSTGV